jgi:pyruvate/2-oxoglutarate dehydrogenase complex dihydrolipoamide dehydrogenase (E3) component
MAFKRIVVVGGGPIGLFCAIDAAEVFKSMWSKVTVVEMRQEYSRMNVPTLHTEIHKHLQHLGIKDQALGKAGIAPLAQLEKSLFD